MNTEPTNSEILHSINSLAEAMQDFATNVDERFNSVDERFNSVDQRFNSVDQRFDGIDKRLDSMDSRLTRVEATMVTKEYLDDKLSDLRGDMVALVRNEDHKLSVVVDELVKRDVFDETSAKQIYKLEPFVK
ncbi:MAG: hypothetical protein NUV81_00060 [bacterium]|nr:hypothetical protein [bacterium]